VPLWRQLNAVATVLIAVRAGKSWTTAQLGIENALRPGVQALAFAVLRQYGTAQVLRGLLAPRTPSPAADALLCSVLALAVASSQSDDAAPAAGSVHYEAHTLVNQAVEAAKRGAATRAQASFINACLRRFLRERDALLTTALKQPVAKWNHPDWWLKRLQRDYPDQWQAILQASTQAGPMTLRVNTQATTVEAFKQALEDQQLTAHAVAHSGLELAHSTYVPALPGYAQGWFSVQDAAAQLAAPMLLDALAMAQSVQDAPSSAAPRVWRVLDACAAPGGKTAHLLEYAATRGWPVEVTALDIDPERCLRIGENLGRLQLQAHIVAADAAQPGSWWDGQPFDAILLDAPCSASGIVRRHPDIRWLRRETDIAQLQSLQYTLLKAMWPLLRPGGPLVYCTCSVFKAEGHDQIQTFVTHNKDALLQPSVGHLLPQSPPSAKAMQDNHLGGHDGFYYAVLVKATAPAQ
jgi:16S rRNA (cytosine967-C5)-methyltransferase